MRTSNHLVITGPSSSIEPFNKLCEVQTIPRRQIAGRRSLILKYSLGVAVCQVLLLISWLSLAPALRLTSFKSVELLMKATNDSGTEDPQLLLAGAAIRNASRNVDVLAVLVFASALGTIVLIALTARTLRGCYVEKIQSNAPRAPSGFAELPGTVDGEPGKQPGVSE